MYVVQRVLPSEPLVLRCFHHLPIPGVPANETSISHQIAEGRDWVHEYRIAGLPRAPLRSPRSTRHRSVTGGQSGHGRPVRATVLPGRLADALSADPMAAIVPPTASPARERAHRRGCRTFASNCVSPRRDRDRQWPMGLGKAWPQDYASDCPCACYAGQPFLCHGNFPAGSGVVIN